MIRPLIIAPPFQVETDACGQIERRLVQHLDTDKFSATVVCKNANLDCHIPGSRIDAIYESKSVYNVSRILNRVGIGDRIFQPDYEWYSWGKRAIKEIKKRYPFGAFDYIHTINMPCSAHLIGVELKKTYSIPWIAQFYDPWFNNPIREKSPHLHRGDKIFEQKVADNADIILHSNSKMVEQWNALYGDTVKEKQYVLPYVSSDQNLCRHRRTDKFSITHIGSFQSFRRSDTFILAVAKLLANHPEMRGKFVVNYVGRLTLTETNLIGEEGLTDVFNLVGYQTEDGCVSFFEETDMFLAVDTDHKNSVFFPSKILKYFNYQKPILGICMPDSVLEMELKESNNYNFGYTDVDGISDFLYRVLTTGFPWENDTTYWNKFSSQNVLDKYEKIVESILNEKK